MAGTFTDNLCFVQGESPFILPKNEAIMTDYFYYSLSYLKGQEEGKGIKQLSIMRLPCLREEKESNLVSVSTVATVTRVLHYPWHWYSSCSISITRKTPPRMRRRGEWYLYLCGRPPPFDRSPSPPPLPRFVCYSLRGVLFLPVKMKVVGSCNMMRVQGFVSWGAMAVGFPRRDC